MRRPFRNYRPDGSSTVGSRQHDRARRPASQHETQRTTGRREHPPAASTRGQATLRGRRTGAGDDGAGAGGDHATPGAVRLRPSRPAASPSPPRPHSPEGHGSPEATDSGDDAHHGPGRSHDAREWDDLWARQEAGLETLSRAMAAKLRHHHAGPMAISRCRRLPPGPPARASDVILVVRKSLRSNGQPRFRVIPPCNGRGEVEIEAMPKGEHLGGPAAWPHGPPPRSNPDDNGAEATRSRLDAELDAWQGRAGAEAASSSGRQPDEPAGRTLPPRPIMKLKRRGGRGNPNRPSQKRGRP